MKPGMGSSIEGKSLSGVLLMIAIVFLLAAGALALFLFSLRPQQSSLINNSSVPTDAAAIQNSNGGETVITPEILDSDHDGLSDTEERDAGTLTDQADSDNDGLNDREELRTFGTQPLTPDTDGDGFLDGDEIRNGYNPRGPGQLFNFEQGLKNINQP